MACICPKCKSNNVSTIMYGYPSPEAIKKSKKGNIKLKECMEFNFDNCDLPDRHCNDCEYEWCLDYFLADDITKVRFRYCSSWGYYDPKSLEEKQWAFEIFPDGTVKYFAYPQASQKVVDKEIVHIEPNRVTDFYWNVIGLYRPWTQIVDYEVCDG